MLFLKNVTSVCAVFEKQGYYRTCFFGGRSKAKKTHGPARPPLFWGGPLPRLVWGHGDSPGGPLSNTGFWRPGKPGAQKPCKSQHVGAPGLQNPTTHSMLETRAQQFCETQHVGGPRPHDHTKHKHIGAPRRSNLAKHSSWEKRAPQIL